MAAKRHERTRARRCALQVLYTGEITNESPTAIAEEGRALDEDGPLPAYALELVRGITEHRDALDGYLAETSENWSLARMPIVDRSILRLATYEMLYVEDVPTSVTINEAVELAKDFGGEDESPRFVNGVLGRIAKRLEGKASEEALGERAAGGVESTGSVGSVEGAVVNPGPAEQSPVIDRGEASCGA